jgi:hypothetical protein
MTLGVSGFIEHGAKRKRNEPEVGEELLLVGGR